MNIHNFANRKLCEYQSIFPTVAALLDHLLFTIGNGYDVDPESGMVVDADMRVDEYPEMTPAQWDELIQSCHEKERRFVKDFDRYECDELSALAESGLAEKCAQYKIVSVSDDDFTEDALYTDLRNMVAERMKDRYYWQDEVMLRPYPLSEHYSDIYNLNENTPEWFLQIALNLCKAWVRFLNEELEAGRVWIKPSLRKKSPKDAAVEEARNKLAEKLISEIVGDKKSSKEEYKEPERDYADEGWTTHHRDMLVDLVARFEGMLSVKA